ncbi:hypothetical protein [Aerosakkonema funiforme]|uniref:hypothetical protein n=1 Tax=Aerosakkonema funiforme TaxID=1246630 RepID=UPI0035BB9ACD
MFVRDRFDRFIVSVFPIPTLFDIILGSPEGDRIGTYQDNKLIYGVSAGNETSLLKETVSIAAYGAKWKLEIIANSALIMGARSLLPDIVLFGAQNFEFLRIVQLAELSQNRELLS